MSSSELKAASKPTILAFHGHGSNATIHQVQLARLTRHTNSYLNIVNLDGPFSSAAGPGVLPFFEGCGPYNSWLPPGPSIPVADMHANTLSNRMPPEVESLVRAAVYKVRSQGGHVVGLIGFSQGTRIVAGLLKGSEMRRALGTRTREETDWLDFAFAVSVCASYPPPLVPPSIVAELAGSGLGEEELDRLVGAKIEIPTLFAQGTEDQFNGIGMMMVERHFVTGEERSVVFEWANGHHYPVEVREMEIINEWVKEQVEKAGKRGGG